MPASIVLLPAIGAPWLLILASTFGYRSLDDREVLHGVAGALLVTLVLLPPFLVVMTARLTPPILAPSGLRLWSARPLSYDTIVPWTEVTGIRTGRYGPFPLLLVQVRDPAALAGADRRLLARMRRHRARHGADLVIPTLATHGDDAYLADAVTRLTGGTLHLEPAPAAR